MRPLAQATGELTLCDCTLVQLDQQLVAEVNVPVLLLLSRISTVNAAVEGVVFTALFVTATIDTLKVGPAILVNTRPSTAPDAVLVSNALNAPGAALNPDTEAPMAKSPNTISPVICLHRFVPGVAVQLPDKVAGNQSEPFHSSTI